ncbi:MAG TPA: MBL fold metallo-hydrolase [Gemmatimonadaceae bacterium]|jgi:glyoxylase-like metal-dependent hydrolase (beta-lactamase superfamily II)
MKLIRLLFAASMCFAASLLAQEKPRMTPAIAAAMSVPGAEEAMKEHLEKVADHVYAIRPQVDFSAAPLPNEVLVEQQSSFVLIDAGKTRGAGLRIVALIRQLSDKPVRTVILTHWHPDHILGLGPIVEAWPNINIVANKATRDAILSNDSDNAMPLRRDATAARDSARAVAMRQYAIELAPNLTDPKLSSEEHRGWMDLLGVLNLRITDERGTYLVRPTVTFTDDYKVEDAVTPVEAISVGPAHTDGDVAVWMPNQQVVAIGDIAVGPIPYPGGHVVEWPATLARVRQLHPKVIVAGHGPVQHGEKFLDLVTSSLMELQFKAQTLVRGPIVKEDDVPAKLDFTEMRRRFAGDDHWLAYWFDQYFAANVGTAYIQLRKLAGKD